MIWRAIAQRQEERPTRVGWLVCVFCIRAGIVVGPEGGSFAEHRMRRWGESSRWDEVPWRLRVPLMPIWVRWWDD